MNPFDEPLNANLIQLTSRNAFTAENVEATEKTFKGDLLESSSVLSVSSAVKSLSVKHFKNVGS
jgi:hypothetical protein